MARLYIVIIFWSIILNQPQSNIKVVYIDLEIKTDNIRKILGHGRP